MAINKVVYGNSTLIDLTEDTVSANNLLAGETAHDRSGASIEGTVVTAEVVDNLTTQDATKALSANQGYVLNQNKVDKVTGKGLSTNDYTNEDKAKLAGISAGAEPNVQSDWKQSDSSSDDFIKNKPTSDIKTSNDGQFTTVTGGLMQSCDIELDPIQDLHGYSKPWTGGSGKNKLPLTVENVKSASTSGTWSGNKYTINGVTYELFANEDGAITSIKATGTATADAPIVLYRNLSLPNGNYMWSASPSGGSGNTYRAYLTGVTASDTGNGATFSISGQTIGVACIISNGYAIPSSGVIFKPQIESGSTKTSFEPYSNICPISGHTQVQVGNVGEQNMLDPSNLGHYSRDNTTGEINGTESNYTSTTNVIRVEPSTAYIITRNATEYGCRVFFYDADKNHISNVVDYSTGRFTTPSNCYYIAFQCGFVNGDLTLWQMVKGSTVVPYKPFNGYTTTINLGGTYYGGTLDAVSGEFTVTHGFKTFNGSEDGWALYEFSTGLYRAYISVADMKPLSADTQVANLVCNQYPTDSYSSPSTSGERITGRASSGQINVFETTQSTLANWKTYLGTNNLQIAYELATPQTIQLTPTQLETLVGQNDVFAPLDGQTVEEVEFREVLSIDDVPKAIPYENVDPILVDWFTIFKIHRYGRVVVLKFDDLDATPVASEDGWAILGRLPERFYHKYPNQMVAENMTFGVINDNSGTLQMKQLIIDQYNGDVKIYFLANEQIKPLGSITYILDHD